MATLLSPEQQAQKDELSSSVASGVDLSTALLQIYKKNAALAKERKESEVIKEPENLLIHAIECNDLSLIEQLITQPLYQTNKSPSPGHTYLERCSTEAFNLIYCAGLYHKEDLQKSMLEAPLLYSLANLYFLVGEGYQLSLMRLLKSTDDMELPQRVPAPHKEYIEFFKKLATENIEQINTEFLLEFDDELNDIAEDWSFYFNIFVAYAMVISSVLSVRHESHYQELGQKLGNKILYVLSLNREYDQITDREQEQIDGELQHYKNKYLIMPSSINNPLILEDLQLMIKELDVKVGQYHLQNKFSEHMEKSNITLSEKKEPTFKV